MAKATTTIRQTLNHKPEYGAWFAANQTLFNQVAAFYFQVIQAHELVLELGNQEAMGALEKLTHATKKNPHPVMPLSQVAEEIPAMFRRAAISAALGSARLALSMPISRNGGHAKRRCRQRARGSRSVRQCRPARGRSQRRSTPGSGKSAARAASYSRFGPVLAGRGSSAASLAASCQMAQIWAVRNW